jgi:hypothetical protein
MDAREFESEAFEAKPKPSYREYSLILYGDEIHCKDEIIAQIMKAIACSYEVAHYIAEIIENKGKAIISVGQLAAIKRSAAILSEISIPFKIIREL